MSQTKKAKCVEAQNNAIEKVTEFFKTECPYEDLMELALDAQTQVMLIESLLDEEQAEQVYMHDLTSFLYYAIKLAKAAKGMDERRSI